MFGVRKRQGLSGGGNGPKEMGGMEVSLDIGMPGLGFGV